MKKPKNQTWIPTTAAAEALGVGRAFLTDHRFDLFRQNYHWRSINPLAARPSYRWHLKRCEQLMEAGDE